MVICGTRQMQLVADDVVAVVSVAVVRFSSHPAKSLVRCEKSHNCKTVQTHRNKKQHKLISEIMY